MVCIGGSFPYLSLSQTLECRLGVKVKYVITMEIPKISRRRPRSVDDPTAGVDPGFFLGGERGGGWGGGVAPLRNGVTNANKSRFLFAEYTGTGSNQRL